MSQGIESGDWVRWQERPAIVLQVVGDMLEIRIWVDASECRKVFKS